jgi:hypothetical protein
MKKLLCPKSVGVVALLTLAYCLNAQTAPVAPASITPAAPAAAAPAAPAAAPTSPVSTPSMEGPLTVNVKPESFDIPDFGKIYVSGAVTGLGLTEDSLFPGDRRDLADVSNAQVFIQKVAGQFQFFIQAGVYSLPSLGAGYLTSGTATTNLYGPLPQAFIKIAPNSNFSIEAGKLPTLCGAEYTFTFENMNIERGLLWNQENAVNRGVQANYAAGPVALSLSWNDGYYSNRYNWLSGAATWTIDSSNTLEFMAMGNMTKTAYGTAATPLYLNNQSNLENLIYSHTSGAWLAQGYLQYGDTKSGVDIGIAKASSTSGAGVLVNYAVPNTSLNLAGRVEYISSSGNATDGSVNLLYGPGSKAWSFTFTPTYQVGVLFTRAEISLVQASSITKGMALGPAGTNREQTRFAIEIGILF